MGRARHRLQFPCLFRIFSCGLSACIKKLTLFEVAFVILKSLYLFGAASTEVQWEEKGKEEKNWWNNFLQMGIYIMSSKIFHNAFIIMFNLHSDAPQGPFPPQSLLISIIFLCSIETRNLLATLNLEDPGSRTCDTTKARHWCCSI